MVMHGSVFAFVKFEDVNVAEAAAHSRDGYHYYAACIRNSITRPWKMTLVANSLLISC